MSKKICSIENCERPIMAKGYCSLHYNRLRQNGNPLTVQCIRAGQTKKPEYKIWGGIKQRCLNPKREKYKRYGGRGILICDRWINSFENFYKDMGPRPTSKHQIDREDNDGNYEPNNCRWVLQVENMRNCSATKLTKENVLEIRKSYSFRKVTHKDLADKFGVCTDTIHKIINHKLWN